MKNKLHPITILLAALVLGSCDFPGGMPGGGNLTVVLPGGNGMALSILSDAAISALRYQITLAGPGGTIEREASGGSVIVAVEPGEWTVTVNAYNAANTLVGTGVETTTVAAGQPASVSVKMTVNSGAGTYYIHNEADLRLYLTPSYDSTGVTAFLERDITVSGSPMGGLRGTIDGQGHTITLNIDVTVSDTNNYVGLLESVSGYATVKNLRLKGSVEGTASAGSLYVGAVAGVNNNGGTIKNVSSTVVVTASNTTSGTAALYTGGIAGQNSGIIQDCSAGEPVTAFRLVSSGDANTGGIAGRNDGTIERCYAWGNVSSSYPSGSTSTGGIAGYNGNTVRQCAALNSVVNSTAGSIDLGRIVGLNPSATLTNNHAYADMQVGSSNTAVTGGVTTNEHGANIAATDLTASNSAAFWNNTTVLNWPVFQPGPSAEEPMGSPWYWAKTITIPANGVYTSPVEALVPALWFE
jgi:hypothetical protein